MNLDDVVLPSNRKFGFFFTVIFGLAGLYFLSAGWVLTNTTGYALLTLSATLLVTTLTKSDLLLPLNKLWMRFGLLLGVVVSPLVLGLIFFGMFTPIGVLMRMFGRDELRLKLANRQSHWKARSEEAASIDSTSGNSSRYSSFKNQF